MVESGPSTSDRVFAISRPHSSLLKYYLLVSACFGPLFPVVFLPHWLKFRTLRYSFDDQGVSMRWGAVHRRETRLNYSRLQDIHLSSNLFERWMGLSRVQLQTASGSAKPEMTLEGLKEYQLVRDFLYRRMRGEADDETGQVGDGDELGGVLGALSAVTGELRAVRELIERSSQ